MKLKEKLGACPIPAWAYALFTTVYCETVFHLWITDAPSPTRLAIILAFALGFGSILALITSLFGHRPWGKWASLLLMGLVSVLYIVEYFVKDAYMTFMTLSTLLGGAKGVATDFTSVVVSLIIRDFWRILVLLLPSIVFALLAKPMPTPARLRWAGIVLASLAYLGGFGLIYGIGADVPRLKEAYHFDNAISSFGLNMGLTLDVFNSGGTQEEASFTPVEVAIPESAPTEAPASEEADPETAATVPNVMALDFAALAQAESNTRIANIHKYVASQEPTMTNAYTGLFKGKNLILIAAEGFCREVIDPELTPTLYRLANEGIRFEDYYQPLWGGSTSTGEFSILTGLVAASGIDSIREGRQQEMFLSISKQLQQEGYFTAAYHNHQYNYYDRDQTHPYYGYDLYMGINNGMEAGVADTWPESDLEMLEFTLPQYIDQQPFSIYYMTVSGHCPYNAEGNAMSKRHFGEVTHLDYSDKVKAYLACQLELELALEHLVTQLEEAGIADDTVIVLTADHCPYGLEGSMTWGNTKDYLAELYGYDPKNNIERDHNALIIWSGCIEDLDLVVEEPTYSLDILPTLSNLFGVTYDSRLLVGRDVFSDAQPIVLWYDYSWKTDQGIFDADTMTFTPAEGVSVDEDYVQRIKNIVSNKISYSREVQKTDYFNYLWEALSQDSTAE